MLKPIRKFVLSVIFSVALLNGSSLASDLAQLQIIPVAGSAKQISHKMDDIEKLGVTQFTTSTIWTDGPTSFSGVSLKKILDEVKATGKFVKLTALNDYSIVIPMADIDDEQPIVATKLNGQPMTVRNKGPFWLVYNYDSDIKYRTETIYSRSIWQLSKIELTD